MGRTTWAPSSPGGAGGSARGAPLARHVSWYESYVATDHKQMGMPFAAQGDEPPAKGGRPPRAGVAATHALRVRLTQEEKVGLMAAAAAVGRSVAEYVRARLVGETPPPAPSFEPPYATARPHQGVAPRLASRWTPRFVWTVHVVPGRREGPPLAVRRRVLGDRDDVGCDIETPGGDMGLDFQTLQETGRARGWGSFRDGEWGCDLALDVYDHNPTLEEREDWLRRHRLIQAVIGSPPPAVYVTVPGPRSGGPDRVLKCRSWRALDGEGGTGRADLLIALPGYREPEIGEWLRNRLTVNLYDLAEEGRAEAQGEGGRLHGVYLQRPTAEQLAHDGARRARRADEQARLNAETDAWGAALAGARAKAKELVPRALQEPQERAALTVQAHPEHETHEVTAGAAIGCGCGAGAWLPQNTTENDVSRAFRASAHCYMMSRTQM